MASKIFEPPVGGLNTRDTIDNLGPTDALSMINWVPEPGFVRSRKGYIEYTEGLVGPVENLAVFKKGLVDILFACANGFITDISDPLSHIQYSGGNTSNRWNELQFIDRLIFMNGVDAALVYNSSAGPPTMTNLVVTGGLDPTDISDGVVYKGRVFYQEINSSSMWYTQAGSFQGELTEFPLDTVLTRGGSIAHLMSWSLDTGAGMDDMLVIMMDTGETLVYQGDDPDDVLGFELNQKYELPAPIADKATGRMASEQIVATRDGYINLSSAIREKNVSDYSVFSSKILRTAKDAVNFYGDNYGWDVVFYPRGNYLLINVPVFENIQYVQHVLNTRNGMWTTFNGWPSINYAVWEDNLFFGTPDGKVMQADFGTSDDGEYIECSFITAFSYYDNMQTRKKAKSLTLFSNHNNPAHITIGMGADFRPPVDKTVILPEETTGSDWASTPSSVGQAEFDVANWATPGGDTDVFEQSKRIRKPVNGEGFALSVGIKAASRVQQHFILNYIVEYDNTGIK